MRTVKMLFALLIYCISSLDLVSICFAQNPWTQKADMKNIRQAHSSGVLDGKIYVIGGVQYNTPTTHYNAIKSMELYDPITDTWDTSKADMNTGRCQFPSCVYDGKIWAIGGGQSIYWDPLKSIEMYDPVSDTWTHITDMPRPRMGHTAALVNGKIYIIGGAVSNDNNPIPEIDVYDPQTNTWDSTKAAMITPRMWLTSVVLNGLIYVIGGHRGVVEGEFGERIIEVYDPTTDTWDTSKADMIWSRKASSACVLDEKIYVFGGAYGFCEGLLFTVESYDPNTDTWTQRTDIPHEWGGDAAVSLNGRAYLSGGTPQICPPVVQKTFLEYNPDKDVPAPQLQLGSFEYEGRTRNYEVYLPYNHHTNMPVVFALHGYTETVQWFKNYTQLHELGNTTGFVTVYPAAIGKSWNSGLIAPGWPYIDTTVDDIGFISALIDTLEANYDIDMNHIYCCGYSLGGEMTYRLAIELGYRFAAVASICGLINDVSGNLGDPVRSIPILHIHGTEDNYETWNGDDKNLWTVPETIKFWLEKNDCSLQADTVTLPDLDTTDGCTIKKISYTDCAENSCLLFYKIINGGHSWPSSSFTWNGEGNKNKDINANEEIWNFFKNYENPLINLAFGKSLEISHKYLPPQGDTLILNAQLTNRANHPVTVYALVKDDEHSFQDSIKLFDDALHNDGNALDNIWGEAKWLADLQEDMFTIEIYTNDLTEGVSTLLHPRGHFTTAGPLTVDSVSYTKTASRHYYSIKSFVRNDGNSMTVRNAEIKLYCNDPWVGSVTTGNSLPDIAPGAIVSSNSSTTIYYIDSLLPSPEYFNLRAEITVNEQLYWTDSIRVDVITTGVEEGVSTPINFTLLQNYPNPFNPSTTFKYSIPTQSKVIIKVYDILGNKVKILVNEEKPAGTYELTWYAEKLSSAVYFYQLQAGEFVKTKKMLLLK